MMSNPDQIRADIEVTRDELGEPFRVAGQALVDEDRLHGARF